MSAFSVAINTIFNDPHVAADALWFFAGAGPAVQSRVIIRGADEEQSFGQARIQQPALTVEARMVDISQPTLGDTVVINGDRYVIQSAPKKDDLRLVWVINLRPA